MIDAVDREEEALQRRRRDRRAGGRAGRKLRISGHRQVRQRRPRSAARRSRSSTCRPRSGCSTSAGQFDEIAIAAKPGVSRREAARREVRAVLPPTTQARTGEQQASEGRAGHELVHLVPAQLPARVRRHRAVRRQLRDRELALDHDRPADARVRDAAHARRDAAPGAALDHHRVARRRHARVDRRALPRPSAWPRACSSSSTPSASRCRTAGSSSRRGRSSSRCSSASSSRLLASLRPAFRATRVPPIAAVREGATLPASPLRPLPHARLARS